MQRGLRSAGLSLHKEAAFAAGDVDGVFCQAIAELDQEFDQPLKFRFTAEGDFKTLHHVMHQLPVQIDPVAFDRRRRLRVGSIAMHQEFMRGHAGCLSSVIVAGIVQLVRWNVEDGDLAQFVNL